MCSLYGIIDYKNCLTDRQKTKMINVLARASAVRGTDATGIASLCNGHISVYKRPLPAQYIRLKPPKGSNLILGHTRMTTQGSERKNHNNHPFQGHVQSMDFALTHNGVLYNDKNIKKAKKLPDTKIETDSYVAVQMIEKEGTLNLKSLKNMAELLEGTFTFALLDASSSFYFVKGNNPLTLLHFEQGFYLYTSTDAIMEQALKKLNMKFMHYREIRIQSGEILKIDKQGTITRESFDDTALYLTPRFYGSPYWSVQNGRNQENSINRIAECAYIDDLKSYANMVGVEDETIDFLLEQGFDTDDIEELLYDPNELQYYLYSVYEEV